VFIDASVTESLVTFATHVVNDLGLIGVTLLIAMSQVVIVPGTEVTMLFAGFSVDQGHMSMLGIIVFGVLGDVLGASIAYAIGYFGLHEALARPGSPIHIDARKIEMTHRWFDRYGSPVVAISRLIPVFRSAPPYAAGIARMPYWRFASMATLGSIVWITGWAFVGKSVGHEWQQWKHHLDYVDYAVVVIVVLALAWWLLRMYRNRGDSNRGDSVRTDAPAESRDPAPEPSQYH
jgi:membrane protein DedA with SNARE-associated domain